MRLINLLFITVVGFALTTNALAQESIREVYVCSFNAGQGMDDLNAARDYYLKQAEKAGIETPDAYVWTPFKGNFSFDFLWFNHYADLNVFGKSADAEVGSPEMAAVMARFNSVADCYSSISTFSQIYDGGEPPVTAAPAFLDSYACDFQPGRSMADLDDLWGHLGGVLKELGNHKAFTAYAAVPFLVGPNSRDIYLFGVNDSASVWAKRELSVRNSKAGQSLMRHFSAVLDCNTSLFLGQRMVPPPE